VILEIGSFKGKSTLFLASGVKEAGHGSVIAIDPHRCTLGEFMNNIKKAEVSKYITPIISTSIDAVKDWKMHIGILWIDGGHRYEMVKKDFHLWTPFLVDNGIVALHDTTRSAGPRMVAISNIYKSRNFKNAGFIGSITYGKKVRKLSFIDMIKNHIVLGLFLFKNYLVIIGRVVFSSDLRNFFRSSIQEIKI
jgi:predicted O-methyltransferase YrrM